MEPRKIIRTDIAASVIAHLTLVALIIVISEVHPFHSVPPETVAVDIVTPEQVKQEEAKAEEKAEQKAQDEAKEKPPEPLPELRLPKPDLNDKPDAALKPAPAKERAAPQSSPQKQASHEPQQKQPQPQPSQVPPQQPPPQPQAAQPPPPAMPQPQAAPPAYRAPEPDVTVKYGVMLGLPPELPPEPKDAPKDDGGDAGDSIGAKLPPEVIAELRRHLRSCSKLPAGVAPTDALRIKLRAVLATDGTLARPPILIEAPPSAKGVAVVQSAMSALQACQPYKMLPVDKYEEWKVIDLSFKPQDFGG
jgi:outer membrane biosynthesis protein TonB